VEAPRVEKAPPVSIVQEKEQQQPQRRQEEPKHNGRGKEKPKESKKRKVVEVRASVQKSRPEA
jgi:hypothetical protein